MNSTIDLKSQKMALLFYLDFFGDKHIDLLLQSMFYGDKHIDLLLQSMFYSSKERGW